MANELYSRPLSEEARAKLIAFVEAYLFTLATERADTVADRAKARAIELLRSDVDIAVFGNACAMLLQPSTLDMIAQSEKRGLSAGSIAKVFVRILEEAHEADKRMRRANRQ